MVSSARGGRGTGEGTGAREADGPLDVPVDWLAAQLTDPSAVALAADLGQMIKHGELRPGVRLPPVRVLAAALNVSPATVSNAWQRLRARNLVTGGGRGGIRVRQDPGTPRPIRYESEGHFDQDAALDLGLSVPEPDLLPDLDRFRDIAVPDLNDYRRTPIVESLLAAVSSSWPTTPRQMLVTNGGYEGLMLVCNTFIQPGDHVIVENPAPPRLLDVIERAGARFSFATRDSEGLVPESVAEALPLRPSMLVLQPSVHNPMGTVMSRRRRDALAKLLAPTEVLVVEDDGIGELAREPVHPLSDRIPEQTLYLRSYSKSHGPDLRIAVLDGPPDLVERVRAFRAFGSGWTSRLLQEMLAAMLTDPQTRRLVGRASDVYNSRREALVRELSARGIDVPQAHGLDLWLPVLDERYAVVTCAAHGVAVSSGSRFTPPPQAAHIRVSTCRLPTEKAAFVADVLVRAMGAKSPIARG